jgi:DNA-binding response OmpR family regulator
VRFRRLDPHAQLACAPAVLRILVIENDREQRELLAETLRAHGYDVETAADGLAGLAAVRQHRPCLVLLDMMMPRMSGWEFMAALEREPGLAGVPVIILSGSRGTMPRQVALGSAVVVEKPFDLDALLALIERHRSRPAA